MNDWISKGLLFFFFISPFRGLNGPILSLSLSLSETSPANGRLSLVGSLSLASLSPLNQRRKLSPSLVSLSSVLSCSLL